MLLKLLTPSNQQPVNILQLQIGLICSVQCLFQQTLSCSRSSTLKGHNTSFPSFSWGTSPALASHRLCRQDLNCIRHHSLGAQVWHYTEDIHLQEDSLDTLIKDIQILTKEFTSKGWAITPHVGQPCHLGRIPENYLVHWGQLHPWHSQKQINIKTIKQTKKNSCWPFSTYNFNTCPTTFGPFWILEKTQSSSTNFTYAHWRCHLQRSLL